MGGLLAFRVGNYDNTAEREQFRFLCEQLKAHYENLNDFCVFAGNYNIGCELDALFIKKDAIIAIEFKNYGGTVVASENGEWKCDGQIIKGGSRKTVLQQARINHSIVRKELKILGVEGRNVKDVPTLVIFNQPIELINNLSATTKSWLHITDNEHFIEKLDDITCPHTDLDPLGIVNLAELLNLNSFYLKEYSNANYDKPSTQPENIAVFEDIKTYEGHVSNPKEETDESSNDKQVPQKALENNKEEVNIEESIALKGFVKQILSSVLKLSDAVVTVCDGVSSRANMAKYGIIINKKFLVKVESCGIGVHCSKLSKFINREVIAINPNIICWQDGDLIDDIHEELIYSKTNEQEHTQSIPSGNPVVKFHKSKTVLPHWLDLLLFNNLNAIYSPEHHKFEYNLNNNFEDIKVYLGTYFPRSYAESFCIFDDLFKTTLYIEALKNAPELNILDFGCGTGGELVGLIVALSKHISSPKVINIRAIDGNHYALISMEKIIETLSTNTHHRVFISYEERVCLSEKDINLKDENGIKYHFILNSKMVCELISRKIVESNCYYKIAEMLSQFLADKGILYILDVTTKDEFTELFYPQLMNQELNRFISSHNDYETLLPLACNNWKGCLDACFMQQTFTVSHSRKSDDDSRVCYRIICKHDFVHTFISENSSLKEFTHIIHPHKYMQDDKSSICPKSINGNKIIDSYNIKL